MTLGLTLTLGLIGAIILILLHVAISASSSVSFSVFCLSSLVWLADQLREEWLTILVDINCAFARCFGTCERLLGDLWWHMSVKIVATRHWFPGNCLHGPALSFPLCLSSLFCVSLSTHDLLSPPQRLAHHDDLYLSICFTPTLCRCAVERCIDCLTEAPEHYLTRNSKDTAPLNTHFHMSHVWLYGESFTVFLAQKWYFEYIGVSVHHKCTWSGVCWWKTSSIHLQLYAFNLLPKCKQTITAQRHVKYSFSSWDTVGPCNQSASQTAD